MVVDDSLQILKATENIVKKVVLKLELGWDVIKGTDGIDILKSVMDDQCDNLIKIIFTDEHMEFMSGSDAVKILKKLEREGKVKPIDYFSVTCFEDEMTKGNILSAGISDVISKPASDSKIEHILRKFIT